MNNVWCKFTALGEGVQQQNSQTAVCFENDCVVSLIIYVGTAQTMVFN